MPIIADQEFLEEHLKLLLKLHVHSSSFIIGEWGGNPTLLYNIIADQEFLEELLKLLVTYEANLTKHKNVSCKRHTIANTVYYMHIVLLRTSHAGWFHRARYIIQSVGGVKRVVLGVVDEQSQRKT